MRGSIDRTAGLSHSQGPPGAWTGPVVLGKDRVACRPRQKRSRRPNIPGPPSFRRPHGQLAGPGAADRARRPSARDRGPAQLGRRQARRRGCRRRGGLRALVRGAACRSGAALATARLQSHRHGAAHQSRPRAARGGGHSGGGRGHAFAHDAGVRPLGRRARRARRPYRPLAAEADRRGSRHRRQQQRRRGAAGAERAGRGARGDRLARRADRDRRRLPHSRHHGPSRLPPGRGRHHQPHASQGLCRRDRPGHRGDHEGSSLQLRHRGLHQVGAGGRAGAAGPRERPAADRGSRQRHAGRPRDLGPAA